MKITNIYVRRLKSKYTGPVEAYSDTCIVNATDIYPDFGPAQCGKQSGDHSGSGSRRRFKNHTGFPVCGNG